MNITFGRISAAQRREWRCVCVRVDVSVCVREVCVCVHARTRLCCLLLPLLLLLPPHFFCGNSSNCWVQKAEVFELKIL
jgi:hypothetical protein